MSSHILSSLTRASRFNLSAEDLLSLVISPHGAPVLTGFVVYRAGSNPGPRANNSGNSGPLDHQLNI